MFAKKENFKMGVIRDAWITLTRKQKKVVKILQENPGSKIVKSKIEDKDGNIIAEKIHPSTVDWLKYKRWIVPVGYSEDSRQRVYKLKELEK
jgi:hypothetical protein